MGPGGQLADAPLQARTAGLDQAGNGSGDARRLGHEPQKVAFWSVVVRILACSA
ncbi:MAG: hypothetical protein AVDCRST_MAG30-2701 [uncultured Solirubrobacteraceae bacterium]|uniref:Uncharacterized protein n=1 Tax=uncultured Solirubrobacteraceae bacterium TaxID=1162706 RepID=A0A6J4T6T4_9ACTN|nr:MAG: hypothetical protein AVDCRST_MAG30-2701 [uncultured Solirubrobacteraceae bacterium]